MSVQYAPTKLRVPPGFQNLLEGLAREVLREQPDDIVVFAAQYFKNQLVIREETGKDGAKQGDQLEKLAKGEEVDVDLNDPKTNEAAVKIQASFRGHKTREELKHKKEEEEAAVKIQSSFRGMKAREQVKEIRESKSQEAVNEKAAAKVASEALDEGQAQQLPSEAAEKPVEKAGDIDIDLNDLEVQGAALKIQASFRGHKAREEVKSLRSQSSHSGPAETEVDKQGDNTQAEQDAATPAEGNEAIDIDLKDPEVQEVALKIQSSFRGHKARESVKSMRSQEECLDGGEAQIQKSENQVEVEQTVPQGGEQKADGKLEEGSQGQGMGEIHPPEQSASQVKTLEAENQEDVESGNGEQGSKFVESEGHENIQKQPPEQEVPKAESEKHELQEEVRTQDQGGANLEGQAETDPPRQQTPEAQNEGAQQGVAESEPQDQGAEKLESPVVENEGMEQGGASAESPEQGATNMESIAQNEGIVELAGQHAAQAESEGQSQGGAESEGSEKGATPSGEAEAEVTNEAAAEQPTVDGSEAKPQPGVAGEDIDIDLADPEVGKAASLIQASFRGHKVRQELKQDISTGSPGGNGEEAEVPGQGDEQNVEEPPRQEAIEEETDKQEEEEQGGAEAESQEQKDEEAENEKQEDTKAVEQEPADAEASVESKED